MSDEWRLPWFPCEASKWLNGLGGLPSDQKLVYSIMLLRIYDAWGPCIDSLETIATRCGFNKRRTADALDALFKAKKLFRVDGGIHNPKAVKIIAKTMARREVLTSAGRAGGLRAAKNRKQNQTQTNSLAIANGKHIRERDIEESLFPNGNKAINGHQDKPNPEAELYRRGKEILGSSAGGFIKRLLQAKGGSIPQARAVVETASEKNDPREYIGGVIRARQGREQDQTVDGRL